MAAEQERQRPSEMGGGLRGLQVSDGQKADAVAVIKSVDDAHECQRLQYADGSECGSREESAAVARLQQPPRPHFPPSAYICSAASTAAACAQLEYVSLSVFRVRSGGVRSEDCSGAILQANKNPAAPHQTLRQSAAVAICVDRANKRNDNIKVIMHFLMCSFWLSQT